MLCEVDMKDESGDPKNGAEVRRAEPGDENLRVLCTYRGAKKGDAKLS